MEVQNLRRLVPTFDRWHRKSLQANLQKTCDDLRSRLIRALVCNTMIDEEMWLVLFRILLGIWCLLMHVNVEIKSLGENKRNRGNHGITYYILDFFIICSCSLYSFPRWKVTVGVKLYYCKQLKRLCKLETFLFSRRCFVAVGEGTCLPLMRNRQHIPGLNCN